MVTLAFVSSPGLSTYSSAVPYFLWLPSITRSPFSSLSLLSLAIISEYCIASQIHLSTTSVKSSLYPSSIKNNSFMGIKWINPSFCSSLSLSDKIISPSELIDLTHFANLPVLGFGQGCIKYFCPTFPNTLLRIITSIIFHYLYCSNCYLYY